MKYKVGDIITNKKDENCTIIECLHTNYLIQYGELNSFSYIDSNWLDESTHLEPKYLRKLKLEKLNEI